MKQLLVAALVAAGVATASPCFALTKADEIGEPGNAASADRTLNVSADTRYLNVLAGETVNIDVNGERVTWDFDGLAPVVDLEDIAPGAPSVKIYISEHDG